MTDHRYPLGVGLLLASGLFLGTSGIAVRSIEAASSWQILFFRSASFVIVVFVVLMIRRKGRIREDLMQLRWDDAVLAVCLGTGFVAYVFALRHTTVANALFVFSSAPFFAAVLGWIVLRERVDVFTWATIGVSMLGLVIMVAGGVSRGHYLGNAIAMWIPVSYAVSVVLVRRSPRVDMLPALCMAGIVATVLSSIFAENLQLTLHDLTISIYLGTFQLGAGFICLILGVRYVMAAQAGIIALIEPVSASLWAWLAVNETPEPSTLVGGGIILTTVIVHSVVRIARTRTEVPPELRRRGQ